MIYYIQEVKETHNKEENKMTITGYYLTAILNGEETLINIKDLSELLDVTEKFEEEGIEMIRLYDKEEEKDVSDWLED